MNSAFVSYDSNRNIYLHKVIIFCSISLFAHYQVNNDNANLYHQILFPPIHLFSFLHIAKLILKLFTNRENK